MRSRRLEVVGERENGRARGRHPRGSRAPVFSHAHHFQAPATQAIRKVDSVIHQAPVVQKMDNAIQWINLYPVDSAYWFS